MLDLKLHKFSAPTGQKGRHTVESQQERLARLRTTGFDETLMVLELYSVTKMALLGLWSFEVSWYGRSWNAGIADLSYIAVNIPFVAYRLNERRAAYIDFYARSFGEEIYFKPTGKGRVVTILKDELEYDTDPPEVEENKFYPRSAEQDRVALVENLRQVAKVYHEAVRDYCPEVWSSDLVTRYFNSRFVKFCIEG